jgi:hypothetical protein
MDDQQRNFLNDWMMYHEICQRQRLGWKPPHIASFLNLDARTVKKYLAMTEDEYWAYRGRLEQRSRKLAIYEDFVVKRLTDCDEASAAQIHDWLKEKHPEFPDVDEKTVYSFVLMVRQKHNIPKVFTSRMYEQVIECEYGSQAQADFGEFNMTDVLGKRRKVYFFAMVLCRSRYKFVEYSDKHYTTQTTILAHEAAFIFFGGYVKEVVYDQDKLMLTNENLGELILTQAFQAYQKDRGFAFRFCRKSDPESKGKIEIVVKYVKYNFLRGRKYFDLHTLNMEGVAWLHRTANAKVHSTTHKRPVLEYAIEKNYLLPLKPSFMTEPVRQEYSVRKTNVINYQGSEYSVPTGTFRPPQTIVYVERSGEEIIIYNSSSQEIARQTVSPLKGTQVRNNNHYRDHDQPVRELVEKTAALFTNPKMAADYLGEVWKSHPRYARDQINQITRVCAKYPAKELDEALTYCCKEKLYNASDFEPVLLSQTGELPSTPAKALTETSSPVQRHQIIPMTSNIEDYKQILE